MDRVERKSARTVRQSEQCVCRPRTYWAKESVLGLSANVRKGIAATICIVANKSEMSGVEQLRGPIAPLLVSKTQRA